VHGHPKLPFSAHAPYVVLGAGWSSRCVASPGVSSASTAASRVPASTLAGLPPLSALCAHVHVGLPHARVPVLPSSHAHGDVSPGVQPVDGDGVELQPATARAARTEAVHRKVEGRKRRAVIVLLPTKQRPCSGSGACGRAASAWK
jgi:hypothetical protein